MKICVVCGTCREWTKPLYEVGPTHNPGARLYGSLDIAGVGHHIEAIEVKRDNEGIWQSILHPEADTNFEAILQATDYPLATVTIQGREYVLLVVPGEE